MVGLPAYAVYHRVTWRMTERIKKIFDRILTGIGLFFLILFFLEVFVSLISTHQVNVQLGFRYATPDTPDGELFVITKVIQGKTMEQSGLRVSDRVQLKAVSDLYLLLVHNQGNEVVIPILRDQKEMKIRVRVPEMDVPLKDVSFLF
jgi:hypothetical protein